LGGRFQALGARERLALVVLTDSEKLRSEALLRATRASERRSERRSSLQSWRFKGVALAEQYAPECERLVFVELRILVRQV